MAEDIVEDVGFLEIIELVGAADEVAGGKAAIGEMPAPARGRRRPASR